MGVFFLKTAKGILKRLERDVNDATDACGDTKMAFKGNAFIGIRLRVVSIWIFYKPYLLNSATLYIDFVLLDCN